MTIWKKAVSAATSAALLASLLATAVAPSVGAVGTITNIVYQANGAVAGSAVAPSTTVAFAAFNPSDALAAGTNITLTLPSGTTVSPACAAANFTIRQSPAAAIAPSGVVVVAGTTVAGPTISFLLPAAAVGTTGASVSIFYTVNGACVITNPTTATSDGKLTVAVQGNGEATLSGIAFVAGPAVSLVLSPLTPTVGFGLTQQFTATCTDVNLNLQTCPATTWTAVTLVGGAGTITAAGLFTATAVGTVTVTANAGAGALTQATVVTVTPVAASVTCTPSSGALTVGATVTCTYSAGSTGLPAPTWTATGFTLAAAAVPPPPPPPWVFTAATAGTGTIVATGSVNSTFTYTISAVVVPPVAAGTWPGTAAGDVAQGTTSVGTATLLLTENAKNTLLTTGTMTVTIVPTNPGNGTVEWAGTPVLSAPDSLGATFSLLGNQLIIKITGHDEANVETISISGLKIKASATASPGGVVATLSDSAFGAIYSAFVPTTVTATGVLKDAVGVGSGALTITLATGSCPFDDVGGATVARPLKIAGTNPENITSAAIGALAGGQQAVSAITPVTTVNHFANDAVTQTVTNCNKTAIGSPAKVVTALKYTSSGDPTVFPGENNAHAGNLQVLEPAAGFLKKDTTLTYTISTAGVVFSKAPTVFKTGNIGVSAAVLSADRKSVVVTVTAASTVDASNVWLGDINGAFGASKPILYDVAADVPGGTFVTVGLALSGGLLSDKTTRTNAIVFRGITATAPTPTVYIGENNQATGLVTLVESAAGFFQSGTGPNNVLAVCPQAVDYAFTFAPWAKVTAGDLKLREGNVVSPDNIVEGSVASNGCYTWTVWTASTAVSTIVIGNSTFSTGPLINVTVAQAPGTVVLGVYSGDGGSIQQLIAKVGFAVATYRNQVAVTALSQPLIAPGATNAPAGDLQVAETGIGQLKAGEFICVDVLWRSGELQDQFLNSLLTNDLPIATASGGLVIGPVSASALRCVVDGQPSNPNVPRGYSQSFGFHVLQQSTAGTGKVVISNIKYTTLTDSGEGPVQLSVWGYNPQPPTSLYFHSTVSNAIVGVAPPPPALVTLNINATSALGNNPTSGYTTKTPKVQAVGKYVTWKFTGGTVLAGQRVNILVAQRINGAWGGPKYFVSRTADANGIVTFIWKSNSALVVNARAQWPGNATYAVSTSPALGAHWQ